VVPVPDSGGAEEELNTFLRSHKVLSVDRRWLKQGATSFWTLCVDYLDGTPRAGVTGAQVRAKIDYKEVLPPAQFHVFSQLRELRKQIAQAEAVPVYAVFTNEQLAEMVTSRVTTRAALEKVAGVGEAKASKYGARMLEVLTTHLGNEHEANGRPV
jgi:superfamily II DNA helicase RecQ